MESCSDSDSNDDGLEIGRRRHGHGDEDIVINTEHASKEVDAEGDGEAEAVAGVDEGMNSCLGRILPRQEGDESGDEEESNNNELTMPKRKLKDPAPVWKHCATRLPDGKGRHIKNLSERKNFTMFKLIKILQPEFLHSEIHYPQLI